MDADNREFDIYGVNAVAYLFHGHSHLVRIHFAHCHTFALLVYSRAAGDA